MGSESNTETQATLCQICCNPKRKTKFNSPRLTICQWCITDISNANISVDQERTNWQQRYMASREVTIKEEILRLEALSKTPFPSVDQRKLDQVRARAVDEVVRREGVFTTIYRSLIDNRQRMTEANSIAEIRQEKILSEHQASVLVHEKKQQEYANEITAHRQTLANLGNEARLKLKDFEVEALQAFPTQSLFTKLLRANSLGLINPTGEISSRPEDEEYGELRRIILREDQRRCLICGRDGDVANLHMHHVIPLYKRGTNERSNLATVCWSCHARTHKKEGIKVTRPERIRRAPRRTIFFAVDIETTGFSNSDHIVEIAAVRFVDGKIEDRFQTFIDIKSALPSRITNLTGITEAMLRGAPSAEDALLAFNKFIGGNALVFHNASFDLRFLNRYAEAFQLPHKTARHCTLELARKRLPSLPNHKLESLVEHFRIRIAKSHRALDDAFATGHVYLALKKVPTPRKAGRGAEKKTQKTTETPGRPARSSQPVSDEEPRIHSCPSCGQKLRVPAKKLLDIRCPACNHAFREFTA